SGLRDSCRGGVRFVQRASVRNIGASVFRPFTPDYREMDTPGRQAATVAAAEIEGARERPVADAGTRAIVVRETGYPAGFHITPHWHARAQVLFATAGTMTVRTPRHAWIVPPSRAL